MPGSGVRLSSVGSRESLKALGRSDHRLDHFFPKERAQGNWRPQCLGERLERLPGREGWLAED